MRLFVKVLKGSECEVTVASCADVLEVKQQLQNQVSIPVDQQKLIFQGKPLVDSKPLSHYKVTDGSKLFLMLKKPGTGVTPATASSTPSHTPLKSPESMSVDIQEEPFTESEDPTGFLSKLHTFLKRHFTEKDAAKVLREFKKDVDQNLTQLSLDDIERLAAAKLNAERGYMHPHYR